MIRAFVVACVVELAITTVAGAAGPYGSIHVDAWMRGAHTNDSNGVFSHCAAGTDYESGVSLIVSQTTTGSWLLGFASQRFRFKQGDALPIDVTFDGQSQARPFATAQHAPHGVHDPAAECRARLPEDEPGKGELKTAEIAGAARAYTMLISCAATEEAESAKR